MQQQTLGHKKQTLLARNPEETKWNGYFKNEPCKDDVYVWKINVTNNKGKALNKTGHVTLMK
jgi:hypothetical protein